MTAVAEKQSQVFVRSARFVTIELASALMGLSQDAVRKRITRGTWIEGKHYRKAPDGRVWMDMDGIEKWVLATE